MSDKRARSASSAESKPESKANIGPWLRAARMRRNTTQPELARHLRTEQSELAMIENGETDPSPDLRRRIQAWINSGGPSGHPKRGPYEKG